MVLQNTGLSVKWVTGGEAAAQAHTLLQETLGPTNVENLQSFMETLASSELGHIRTRMLCASDNRGILGLVVGARLNRLNAAMLLYSAVRKDARHRGLYTALRAKVLYGLKHEDGRPLDFIVSELERGGVLWHYYRRKWDAWVLPYDYNVPCTQGLTSRPLDLVVVPIAKRPGVEIIEEIVREIYEVVYRIVPENANEEYHHVVQLPHNDKSSTNL